MEIMPTHITKTDSGRASSKSRYAFATGGYRGGRDCEGCASQQRATKECETCVKIRGKMCNYEGTT